MSASKTRLRLWLKLLKLTRSIESDIRENLRREFASTLPRFDVMAALARYPDGLKMSELSDVLRVSNGNVTGIVDRLTDDEMVVRDPVEGDRRAFLVRLLPKGEIEFARHAAAHEAWINAHLNKISEERAQRLIALIDEMEQEEEVDAL